MSDVLPRLVQSTLDLASAHTAGNKKKRRRRNKQKNNLLLIHLLDQFEVHQEGFLCTPHCSVREEWEEKRGLFFFFGVFPTMGQVTETPPWYRHLLPLTHQVF